jgi:hypothetical protein
VLLLADASHPLEGAGGQRLGVGQQAAHERGLAVIDVTDHDEGQRGGFS